MTVKLDEDLQHFVNLLPADDGANLIAYIEKTRNPGNLFNDVLDEISDQDEILATLRAENARYREIVATLAGWHENLTEAVKESGNYQLSIFDCQSESDIEDVCEKAWKALNGGGDVSRMSR